MRLLDRARSAGLAVSVEGGRLALEGPEDLEALALELLAAEAGVLAELEAERARREAEAPLALLPDGADADRPPSGWTYLRSGALAGCWVGPDCELDCGRPSGEPGGAGKGPA